MRKKVVWLPYDFDTAIGINNEGSLVFSYNLEDTDHTSSGADIFNGQDSVVWCNLRDAFGDEIKSMYQTLRSQGKLSYDKVERMFEEHQAKWPEAIFNEDAWFKYLKPLVDDGSGAYLAMLQGSKAEQRKWWLYNRFRYIDSKYNAGDALTDVIQLRGYTRGDSTITPYADVYVSVKYGSVLQQTRATRNQAYTIPCLLDGVNDTEIYIYSASQLASLGDLSGLKVGFADFSMGTKLQSIILGSSNSSYSNGNLKELYFGNNKLLHYVDVRNCVGLGTGDMKSVDISGCTNIEEVYFDGTNVTSVNLPAGGILKKLHLPSSITNLTLIDQKSLTELTIPSYSNISTLRLENASSVVNSKAILNAIPEGSRVRITGFAWEVEDAAELSALKTKLDSMRGLDESGGNMDTAQVAGSIHTSALTGAEIASFNSSYPYVTVTADHVASYLTYKTYDGSETLKIVTCQDGVPQSSAPSGPARSSTAQYSYTFVGWNTSVDAQTADSSATTNVTADRTVYAAYSRTTRTYTVTWKNSDGTTLETDTNVPYGTVPTYNGSTPTYSGQTSRWWTPTVGAITGDTTYTASYVPMYTVRFYNGTELLQTLNNVPEGSTATYTGETPTSSVSGYEFVGWDVSLTNITANTDAHAVFIDTSDPVIKYVRGTLDEYESNTATSIATYAFYRQTALTTATTSAISIASYAFDNCTALTTVDLTNTSACTIASNAFSNCAALESLIVRSSTVSTLSATSALTGSKIAMGLGGIYVPAGLVSSYKTATNWSTYASNIYPISEYPKTDYSTITDTWEQIFAAEADGTYSSKYHVGDTKSVSVYNTTMYMQIAAIDTDVLSNGSGNAKITWLCKSILTTHNMNSSNVTTGGWPATAMRSWLLSDVMTTLPTVVQNNIKTVDKTYYDYGSSSTATSTDTIWIPSYREVFGGTSMEGSGAVYSSLFTGSAARVKYNSSGSASTWWLRSASSGYSFYVVYSGGSYNNGTAGSSSGVVFGFCT